MCVFDQLYDWQSFDLSMISSTLTTLCCPSTDTIPGEYSRASSSHVHCWGKFLLLLAGWGLVRKPLIEWIMCKAWVCLLLNTIRWCATHCTIHLQWIHFSVVPTFHGPSSRNEMNCCLQLLLKATPRYFAAETVSSLCFFEWKWFVFIQLNATEMLFMGTGYWGYIRESKLSHDCTKGK